MAEFDIMQSLLEEGEENALLRFTMGSAFIKHGKYAEARTQLARAIELKPDYVSAWRLYVDALRASAGKDETITIIEQGIATARSREQPATLKELQLLLKSVAD